eukprot:1192574-Prorocentrum_minimum.AAC.2
MRAGRLAAGTERTLGLDTDQSDAVSVGMFSRRTNQTQETLLGLDTETAEGTVKTLRTGLAPDADVAVDVAVDVARAAAGNVVRGGRGGVGDGSAPSAPQNPTADARAASVEGRAAPHAGELSVRDRQQVRPAQTVSPQY